MAKRDTSRQKILNAAMELARKDGSAHISLDAIAARAGVSKGGLLYNFPSKTRLLEALVKQYVDFFAEALDEDAGDAESRPLAERYLDLSVDELQRQPPPPSGLLAALAEDPNLLAPVRQLNRTVLDRMKAETQDEASVLTLFLVVQGLHALKAFGTDVLSPEEHGLIVERMRDMLARTE